MKDATSTSENFHIEQVCIDLKINALMLTRF